MCVASHSYLRSCLGFLIWDSSLGKRQKGGFGSVVWCKKTVLMFLRRVVCFAPSSNS